MSGPSIEIAGIYRESYSIREFPCSKHTEFSEECWSKHEPWKVTRDVKAPSGFVASRDQPGDNEYSLTLYENDRPVGYDIRVKSWAVVSVVRSDPVGCVVMPWKLLREERIG